MKETSRLGNRNPPENVGCLAITLALLLQCFESETQTCSKSQIKKTLRQEE